MSEGGPKSYEGHDVWEINALGTALAMAAADETTGVAASGTDATSPDAARLVETSLDAFDGRNPGLLNAPGLGDLVGNVLPDVQALPGCTGAVVTAGMLSSNLVVLHALTGFADQDQTLSTLECASEELASLNLSLGFEEMGLRQEGERSG